MFFFIITIILLLFYFSFECKYVENTHYITNILVKMLNSFTFLDGTHVFRSPMAIFLKNKTNTREREKKKQTTYRIRGY